MAQQVATFCENPVDNAISSVGLICTCHSRFRGNLLGMIIINQIRLITAFYSYDYTRM